MTRFTSVVREHWPGYDGVKRLFIFGDSYSSVGYNPSSPAPTEAQPLGVPFPGLTWTDGGELSSGDSTKANWIGHLINLRRKDGFNNLLVYDYAVGGHTISGLKYQIENWYLPNAAKKPDWAPWSAEDSLFVSWIGINDCASSRRHEDNIKRLFALQEELHETGARNFMLVDVPPIHLSPAFSFFGPSPDDASSYNNWNEELHKGAWAFHQMHPETTLLMYSSWDLFSKVIENPETYGFNKSDSRKAGGKMWMDHLHPTSKMHAVLADDIDGFLKCYQKGSELEKK